VTDDPESTAKVGLEPTDVELVKAYRNGDIHAFEELHRRYVASIYRLVRRKLGDALLAEDIAQETFMKALRMMDRVDDSFNFGGWVHTVARNLCFDELRRRQRDLRADAGDDNDSDLLASLPARCGQSPSDYRRSTGSCSPCASSKTLVIARSPGPSRCPRAQSRRCFTVPACDSRRNSYPPRARVS
jgi:RNA polymerase sigma factor (sigma-70 family)